MLMQVVPIRLSSVLNYSKTFRK